MRLAQPIETKWRIWLRGVDLNHQPLGYEPQKIFPSLYSSLIYLHLVPRFYTLFRLILFPTCSSICSQNNHRSTPNFVREATGLNESVVIPRDPTVTNSRVQVLYLISLKESESHSFAFSLVLSCTKAFGLS
jgi:hypothetical protein